MASSSAPRKASARLWRIYLRMREHFGYAPGWWPGSPFDIFVTALLVQQSDWSVAWSAMGRLREHGVDGVGALGRCSPARLQAWIHPVAFAPTKAQRLVTIGREVESRHGTLEKMLAPERPTREVRSELLQLPGIGDETADAILNFAGRHERLVVDAYIRRIAARVGGLTRDSSSWWQNAPYERIHHHLVSLIDDRLRAYGQERWSDDLPLRVAVLRDVHAQFTELGKHHCLKSRPRCRQTGVRGWRDYFHCAGHCQNACSACPLLDICRQAAADR